MHSVPAGHPAFDGHFPGNPLLPGAYLLALVLDEARGWLGRHAPGWRPVGVRAAKFTRVVRPGEAFSCEFVHVPARDELRFVVRAADGQAHASGAIGLAS